MVNLMGQNKVVFRRLSHLIIISLRHKHELSHFITGDLKYYNLTCICIIQNEDNYLTSCNPRRGIYSDITIWHSVWHIFWHSIWHLISDIFIYSDIPSDFWSQYILIFCLHSSHIYIHTVYKLLLTSYLTFHLTFDLTYMLIFSLTFCLTYVIWHLIWQISWHSHWNLFWQILLHIVYLTCYLINILTFHKSDIFPGTWSGILSDTLSNIPHILIDILSGVAM